MAMVMGMAMGMAMGMVMRCDVIYFDGMGCEMIIWIVR